VSRGPRVILLARVVLAVGAANLVAEVLVYGAIIAPSMREGSEVSLWVWGGMYVPVLLACAWVSAWITTPFEAVLAGLTAGAVAQIEKWILAMLRASGHESSLAALAPAEFWTTHFARMTAGFIVLFAILFAARRALGAARRSAG
jgi:hypothetical protein